MVWLAGRGWKINSWRIDGLCAISSWWKIRCVFFVLDGRLGVFLVCNGIRRGFLGVAGPEEVCKVPDY